MADEEISYKGADPDELMAIACKAIACKAVSLLCNRDPALVKPDEDGEILCTGESSGVYVHAESDPAALAFRTYLLDGIQESAALYVLPNEINADIIIGQLYYSEDNNQTLCY